MAMTYTTEDDIKAMATAICEERNHPDWPCRNIDFDVALAKAALAASPVHAELERVRAENGWLREDKAMLNNMLFEVTEKYNGFVQYVDKGRKRQALNHEVCDGSD